MNVLKWFESKGINVKNKKHVFFAAFQYEQFFILDWMNDEKIYNLMNKNGKLTRTSIGYGFVSMFWMLKNNYKIFFRYFRRFLIRAIIKNKRDFIKIKKISKMIKIKGYYVKNKYLKGYKKN